MHAGNSGRAVNGTERRNLICRIQYMLVAVLGHTAHSADAWYWPEAVLGSWESAHTDAEQRWSSCLK